MIMRNLIKDRNKIIDRVKGRNNNGKDNREITEKYENKEQCNNGRNIINGKNCNKEEIGRK